MTTFSSTFTSSNLSDSTSTQQLSTLPTTSSRSKKFKKMKSSDALILSTPSTSTFVPPSSEERGDIHFGNSPDSEKS